MARSMVSVGTDASRAFWNMVRNVAFDSMSPPPSRAATSTWRMSLANSLPRALSAAPFLCLIVAHFEWPDISHTLHEELMEPQVTGELRVKRCHHDRARPAQHRVAVDLRQHLDVVADPLDVRRTDEDRGVGATGHPRDVEVDLERVDLAPEGVAAHGQLDGAEAALVGPPVEHLAREQDHPRACPQRGHPGVEALGHRPEETGEVEQLGDGGRLAAGQDERVDGREVLRHAHLDRVRAELSERLDVLSDV